MFEWNLEVVAIEKRPGASLAILKWVCDFVTGSVIEKSLGF